MEHLDKTVEFLAYLLQEAMKEQEESIDQMRELGKQVQAGHAKILIIKQELTIYQDQIDGIRIEQEAKDRKVNDLNQALVSLQKTLQYVNQDLSEVIIATEENLDEPMEKITSKKKTGLDLYWRIAKQMKILFSQGNLGPEDFTQTIMSFGVTIDSPLRDVLPGMNVANITVGEDIALGVESLYIRLWTKEFYKIVMLHNEPCALSKNTYMTLFVMGLVTGDPDLCIWDEQRYQSLIVERMGKDWNLTSYHIDMNSKKY